MLTCLNNNTNIKTDNEQVVLPGSCFIPLIISFLLFCMEILSSDIIRANIVKARNWLV